MNNAFFSSDAFSDQCSSPYKPEKNGRAERYNRILIERTCALLLHFNLPTMLWGEAINGH
jgi:hypothetical protein